MTIVIVILGALALLAVAAFIILRNSIVGERNRCEEAWSGIEAQLKRRHDLVPNLIEAVEGYVSHEQQLFASTAEARARAMRAEGPDQAAEAEGRLGAALADLRAVAEGYPELRASENFQQLSASLAQIESDIAAAREGYNADAQGYNTKIQIFPNSIVARHGSFEPREYFEIDEADERGAASVRFDRA